MVQFKMTRKEADQVAERTSDAYSFDRYTSWKACAIVLMDLGYDVNEAEAILRSKHTRWAADSSNKPYGRANSSDLKRYLENPQNVKHVRGTELAQLVEGTI